MAGKFSAGPSPLSSSRVDLAIGGAEDVIMDAEVCGSGVKLWRFCRGETQSIGILNKHVWMSRYPNACSSDCIAANQDRAKSACQAKQIVRVTEVRVTLRRNAREVLESGPGGHILRTTKMKSEEALELTLLWFKFSLLDSEQSFILLP